MSLSVAVAGASGYAGGELLRLLSAHPEFEVTTVTAFTNAGRPLVALQPHLRSLAHLELQSTDATTLAGHDVVFLALPHGMSGTLTADLSANTLVVDCGADHRLTSEDDWAKFYGGDYFGAWTYGLPELLTATGSQRDSLRGATRIAVPGCNATAITLALAPGIHSGLILADDLVSVLAVGPSGAGKSLKTELLGSELMGSAHAYQLGGVHRHNPEIRQNLETAGGVAVSISFTPVLVPMSRGILATSTAKMAPGATERQVRAAWESAYVDEPFVH
uniref:N-acetyl-gamma-glutamyl-phosphate reductase n=1 Tax=Salinibacterium sp. TaxID=1915057 RepID=UPI00286CC4C3